MKLSDNTRLVKLIMYIRHNYVCLALHLPYKLFRQLDYAGAYNDRGRNTVITIGIPLLSMPSYRTERTKKSGFLLPLAACIVSMAIAVPPDPFLPNIPGHEWKKVGYLNMSDPAQQCPSFWKEVEPMHIMLRSCGKKTNTSCDSLPINISASFQHVCGRFRGYQVGTPDAFYRINKTSPVTIDTYYVDGISITYGLPGSRHHVYTYAVGNTEFNGIVSCPCAGGKPPPLFVNECDYYCESGSKKKNYSRYQQLFDSDVLWDGQQCDGSEITCCRRPDLPWFCKSFLNPISENLEVRICTDEPVSNENIALDFFELYVSVLSK